MTTPRTHFVSPRMAASAVLLLSMTGLAGCNKVETAGCGPIAASLRPVDSTVYTVRLGSMDPDTKETGRHTLEAEVEPRPRSTRAVE